MNKEKKRDNHRPLTEIDWDKVDYFLKAGCLGTEIASNFGICADTLYRRTEEKYGMTFSAYSQQKRQSGEALLRVAQFQKALKGDNTMMVWLGKNRLGQKDAPDAVLIAEEQVKKHDEILNLLKQCQSSLIQADINNSTDNKS